MLLAYENRGRRLQQALLGERTEELRSHCSAVGIASCEGEMSA